MPSALQSDLFEAPAAAPPGLRYTAGLITSAEEAALAAAIADLPLQPFDFHGYKGNRRVAAFGWRYDYSRGEVHRASPIPDTLVLLRERVAAFAGRPAEDFVQALVTEYAPGAGIGWHRDRPQFGEVVGVSLLAPCTLRFRKERPGGWERIGVDLEPRSAYLMTGPSRGEWQHSIAPLPALRYSVTFRTPAAGGLVPGPLAISSAKARS